MQGGNILQSDQNKPQMFIIANGDKYHEFQFTYNDAIFELMDPNDGVSANQNPFCNCCKEVYKSYKDAKYCSFCALAYCQKCCNKTKVFPCNRDLDRGDICKVCDRKFHIKTMLHTGHA